MSTPMQAFLMPSLWSRDEEITAEWAQDESIFMKSSDDGLLNQMSAIIR